MGVWIKHFSDFSIEIGSDKDISIKKASWSKGRLDKIIMVQLVEDNKQLSIRGIGEWWQSDDYIVINGQEPIRKLRRVQKKITNTDRLVLMHSINDKTLISICDILDSSSKAKVVKIFQLDDIGKWFTVEFSNRIKCYVSDVRI